jgi:transcriptional regulator of acetoin/glycerol metabolism
MQPGSKHFDLLELTAAWEHFRTQNTVLDGIQVDPLVVASWQRCTPRLNATGMPQWVSVSPEVLPLLLNQNAALRAIARPIMEDIHQFIESAKAVLILADRTTCLLEAVGDRETLAYVEEFGMRQGIYLNEGHIGTNAWAMALLESSPIQIVGPEHFLSYFHTLSSMAAPIYDLEGNPLGVIGLLEHASTHSAQSLGIVVAAAKAIENQLQANLFVHEANTQATQLNATLDAISEGIIAWTARGVIMHLNHAAGQLLTLTPSVVVGRWLNEYITLPESLARAIARGEELSDVETTLSTLDGTVCECLIGLRTICDSQGQPVTHIATLRRLAQVHQLVTKLAGAQARLTIDDVVGHTPAAKRVRRQALSAAGAKACVLLVGESGTGKNVLARAIHNSGKRANGPFLAINCRAIPHALALGEFLGFEAGAFNSGPTTGQPSKFELANGGTLFLEEVEALPLDTQAALLRVIEAEDVIRLGGTRVIPVDTRIIASSASHLDTLVAEGAFRGELLLRLSSFVINPIPLRERPDDIPILVERLLEKLSAQIKQTLTISQNVIEILCIYPWPGNVRELESVIERMALLCEGQTIRLDHLPAGIRKRRVITRSNQTSEPVRSLSEAEESAIRAAVQATRGNQIQTAEILGIGRTTLWRKMKSFGITSEDFR